MVSVKCVTDGCDLKDVDFNVLGNHEVVECGACSSKLPASDLRPDPEGSSFTFSE
jgi:hypothetical protein